MRGQFEGPRPRLDNETQNLPIKTRLRKVPKESLFCLPYDQNSPSRNTVEFR